MKAFRRLTVSHCLTDAGDPCVKVAWALERSFAAPGPYGFRLERLYGPSDDQPVLIATGGDGHWMFDNDPRRPQKGVDYYYRVTLVDANGDEWPSPVVSSDNYWTARDWRLARQIVRRESMLMRKRTGTYGWLLKRRYWGTPCGSCVDPVTGQVDQLYCDNCYGTRFEEGYHTPTGCWVVIEQSQRTSTLGQAGHDKQNLQAMRMLAYPPPEPGDIWVHAHTDQRYRIGDQLQPSAIHRGIPLVLQVQAQELPTSDAVYAIPVGEVDAASN